jgi:hypothetical protein
VAAGGYGLVAKPLDIVALSRVVRAAVEAARPA